MHDVNVDLQREFAFPADQVWDILRDFGNIGWALPGIRIDLRGSGPGMVRTLHMPGVAPVEEVLETLNDETRTFSYVIPGALPMPVTDFRGDVRVEALSAERCRLHWRATGTAIGEANGEEIAGMLAKGYENLFAALEARCQANTKAA